MGGSNDLALKVLLQAENQTGGVMSGFGSSLSTFLSNPAAAAGVGMLALGATIVGVGVKATQMAADYDQHMRSVQSLTGANDAQMKQYDTSIKSLAMDAGVGPTKLTDSLYTAISAMGQGKNAIDVMNLATKDSVIGMTDSATTTNALTTVLKGFSVQSKDYTRVNGEMLSTVTLGKMTMADYAGAVGKAASTSMQYKVSMENMNASIATMTSNGIPSARQAVTDYNQTLKVMYGNIGTVSKSLNKSGVAFNEAKFNTLDYQGKIEMLNAALQQANDKHIKVTGVTQQAAQAIQVLSQHSQEYTTDLNTLSDKQKMAEATQNAWNITQGGFNQTMNRLHATLDVVMISIGQKLLPAVTKFAQQLIPIVQKLGDWLIKSGALQNAVNVLGDVLGAIVTVIGKIIDVGSGFVDFMQKGGAGALAVKIVLGALLGAALGFVASGIPALVTGFIAWATAAGGAAIATIAAAAPFILIGLLVGAVVVGIILAFKNWGAITTWFKGVWSGFSSWFQSAMGAIGNFFHTVWDGITSFFGQVGSWLTSHAKQIFETLALIIGGPIVAIALLIYDHWGQIKAFLQAAWNWILSTAESVWKSVTSVFSNAWSGISSAINGLWSNIKNFFANLPAQAEQWGVNLINGFISGIENMAGAVGNAAGGIIKNVENFMGFHSPAKQGAGATADQWSPNLMKMFISGISNNIPALKNMITQATNELNKLGGTHPTRHASTHHKAVSGSHYSAMVGSGSGASGASSGASGASGGLIINNYITIQAGHASADDVAKKVVDIISRNYRGSANIVTNTSGGRIN